MNRSIPGIANTRCTSPSPIHGSSSDLKTNRRLAHTHKISNNSSVFRQTSLSEHTTNSSPPFKSRATSRNFSFKVDRPLTISISSTPYSLSRAIFSLTRSAPSVIMTKPLTTFKHATTRSSAVVPPPEPNNNMLRIRCLQFTLQSVSPHHDGSIPHILTAKIQK